MACSTDFEARTRPLARREACPGPGRDESQMSHKPSATENVDMKAVLLQAKHATSLLLHLRRLLNRDVVACGGVRQNGNTVSDTGGILLHDSIYRFVNLQTLTRSTSKNRAKHVHKKCIRNAAPSKATLSSSAALRPFDFTSLACMLR